MRMLPFAEAEESGREREKKAIKAESSISTVYRCLHIAYYLHAVGVRMCRTYGEKIVYQAAILRLLPLSQTSFLVLDFYSYTFPKSNDVQNTVTHACMHLRVLFAVHLV